MDIEAERETNICTIKGGAMSRLPITLQDQLPLVMQPAYQRVTGSDSGLATTYQVLFASPEVAARLADLDYLIRNEATLEPLIRLIVGLAVAKERNNRVMWASLEPLARQAGVRDAVIEAISCGTGPRGLLPKEGVWIHFTL